MSATRSSSAGASWLKSGTFWRMAVTDTIAGPGARAGGWRLVCGGGKLTSWRGRCQFGAVVAACCQLVVPVIFPLFVSFDFQSRIASSETRDSPQISAGDRTMRLRQHFRHELHRARDPCRGLRQVPPLLHRQAETHGYGRAGGAVPPEVPGRQGLRLTHGGPTPPGDRKSVV